MFEYTLNINSWTLDNSGHTQEIMESVKPKRVYQKRNEPQITLRESFTEKYPEWTFILDELKESLGSEPKWKSLTKSNLVRFISHLNSKFAPNTVNQYASRLKAVLHIWEDELKLPKDFAKILSPKKIPSTAVFLTEGELKLLEGYKPVSELERFIRNLFVCSAYTGARYSDILRMNKSNIRENELVFVAQKTHKESRLPLKPIVAQYIKDMPKRMINKMSYIRIIQRICKNVGIWETVKILKSGKEVEMPKYEAVGSHTARRSFATNLYLRGVDIYTISRLMQHSGVKLTSKYICVNIKPLNERAMEYFN